jgi:hypothetical protein
MSVDFSYLRWYASAINKGEHPPQIKRKHNMQRAYDDFMYENDGDLTDYVLEYLLRGSDYRIFKNSFPYDISSSVSQYVLWVHPDIDINMLNVHKIIHSTFNGKELVYFRNPISYRSVPGVSHVHIFVKDKK